MCRYLEPFLSTLETVFPTAVKIEDFLEDAKEKSTLPFYLKIFRKIARFLSYDPLLLAGLIQKLNAGCQVNSILE